MTAPKDRASPPHGASSRSSQLPSSSRSHLHNQGSEEGRQHERRAPAPVSPRPGPRAKAGPDGEGLLSRPVAHSLPALLPPSAQGLLSAPLGLGRTHESTSGKCSELLREKSPEGPKVGTITNKHAHLLAPQFIVGPGGNAWGLARGLATNRCRQVATSWSPNSCKGDK